jgi:DNA-binding FrmR family transcriptional regulator
VSKPGYIDQKSAVKKRLQRIEGQVRGLERMVDEDQYCINILDQISATTRALQAVAMNLLDDHLSHCVSEALRQGGPNADAKIKEAQDAIRRLVRS